MNERVEPHFLLVGNGSSHNRGCEALTRTTVSILRSEYPQATFAVASRHPESDQPLLDIANLEVIPGRTQIPDLFSSIPGTNHTPREETGRAAASRLIKAALPHGAVVLAQQHRRGVEADCELARPTTEDGFTQVRHLKAAMQAADMMIVLGGDTLVEDFGPPTYVLELMEYAQYLKRPTMIWGASMWPFRNKIVEARVRETCAHCDLITVRDQLSVDYLASLGLTDNVHLVADGAFLMQPTQSPRTVVNWDTPAQLTVGFSGTGLYLSKYKHLASVLVQFIRTLTDERNANVVLIPHDAFPGARERDVLYELELAVDRPEAVFLPPLGLNAPETKAVIEQCDLFVGMRFHPTIASLSLHIPTMGLYYSPKFTGLHQEVYGHTDFLIAYEAASVDGLLERFDRLYSERKAIREHLSKRVPELQELAQCNGKYVKQVLG